MPVACANRVLTVGNGCLFCVKRSSDPSHLLYALNFSCSRGGSCQGTALIVFGAISRVKNMYYYRFLTTLGPFGEIKPEARCIT